MTKTSGDTAPPPIDPMIAGALTRLQEIGPKWTADEKERWCALFVATVDLIYPSRAPRKSRAKSA